MVTHPDCLKPKACDAKGKNRDGGPPRCHRCMMTARNKTDAQRKAVREEKLKNPTIAAMKAVSNLPHVRQRAAHTRLDREGHWCPREYRDVNRKLRSAKVPLEDRKSEIAKMIADDANKPVVEYATFSERIAMSHERMKRGGSFYAPSGNSSLVPRS